MDKLNTISYAYHYRDLDSTQHYAREALARSASYASGRAEAMNNLAFVSIIRMDYDEAERLLDDVLQTTDNQVELLIADIQQMRLCQRRSRNRDFYDFRERALQAQRRINEERVLLDDHQQRRMTYAETELAIVTSTYYYYIGLERQSIQALEGIEDVAKRDTAQFLNYLYNVGAGGIITHGSQADINQAEFDCLMHCFQMAQRGDYPYFAANALEAMADHLLVPEYRDRLIEDNQPAMNLINPEGISDELLPVWLADGALMIFSHYGDVYQIAGAYRTLASCYRAMGDYESALFNLEQALADTTILQAPDLVASIREQLSVAYAAINDKPASDNNRNLYLDLQEQTRQDRYMESRAAQYDQAVSQLNGMLVAVVAAIVLLVFLLWLFNYLSRRQKPDTRLADLIEERTDELAVSRQHLVRNERKFLEQRARISLVNSVTPFIDRIIHAISHMDQWEKTYVCELTDQINDYNDVLTHWIQLQQGELSLSIESFPLQPVFDLVARGKASFLLKGVTLDVLPTTARVKADRVLTVFMLNTLADNARKFTPDGGRVEISASETDSYVEVSVSDTGCGMAPDVLGSVFDRKMQGGHGFGLQNCRGIIEKYRKLSQIFAVCTLQAESEPNRGSRFFFRLPKGVLRLLLPVLSLLPLSSASASNDALAQAKIYADSAYFSNINGTFRRTLLFADSCRYYLNQHYLSLRPKGRTLMQELGNPSLTAPEIKWLHDSVDTNFDIVLDIRNESAVAALALHDWQRYSYNNKIYTQLFKELSADTTLDAYCRTMQQSQANRIIAVILLVLVLIAILPAYYLLYYRPRLNNRMLTERQQREQLELVEDELRRTEQENGNLHVANAVLDNCLSTLKHETMYYPSRIRQLMDSGDMAALGETVSYYRDLYALLSEQAMRQVERAKLHVRPIVLTPKLPTSGSQPSTLTVLADQTLLDYLFELLARQAGTKQLAFSGMVKDDKYVVLEVPMPALQLTDVQAQELFTPSASHIPFLLCRQIVRDHGEATNRRGCGIRAEVRDGQAWIVVTLPKAKQPTT